MDSISICSRTTLACQTTRSLRCALHAKEDYDTYVGEEVWDGHIPECPEDDDEVERCQPTTQEVECVIAVAQAALTRHRDVEVCGMYGYIDDAAWAVPSRSSVCHSARDIFSTMKMSSRLMADLEKQRVEHASAPAEIHLVQHMEAHPSCDFRLFAMWQEGCRAFCVLGICQRHVDQVFVNLASLSKERCEELFLRMKTFTLSHECFVNANSDSDLRKVSAEGTFPIIAVDLVCEEDPAFSIMVRGVNIIFASAAAATDSDQVEVDIYRLFGSYANLIAHYRHHRTSGNSRRRCAAGVCRCGAGRPLRGF